MKTRITHAAVVLLGIVLLLAAARPTAAQQPPVFKASTDVVRVDVVVIRDGRPVSNLGASNFEVRDDGNRHAVRVIPGRDLPVQAILVLDTSVSVKGEKLARLKQAGRLFLEGLSPKDCTALVSFSFDARLRTTECTDRETTRSAFERLETLTSTSLYDAMYAALSVVEPRRGRSVLVVLSDGEDNTSWLRPDDVVDVAKATDATVYAVALAKQRTGSYLDMLTEVTRETGGRLWLVGDDVGLQTAFNGVLEELRNRYVLSFEPRETRPGWHKLEVRLQGVEGELRARSGYMVER